MPVLPKSLLDGSGDLGGALGAVHAVKAAFGVPLENRIPLLVIVGEAALHDILAIVGAATGAHPLQREAVGGLQVDDGGSGQAPLFQQPVEKLGLSAGPRVAVKNEAVLAIGSLESVFHQLVGQFVAGELAVAKGDFEALAEVGFAADLALQQVGHVEGWNAVLAAEVFRLGSFAAARGTDEDHHQVSGGRPLLSRRRDSQDGDRETCRKGQSAHTLPFYRVGGAYRVIDWASMDMERAVEFLLAQQARLEARTEARDAKFAAQAAARDAKFEAQFEARQAKFEAQFEARQAKFEARVQKIERLVKSIATELRVFQRETRFKIAALVAVQAKAERRMDRHEAQQEKTDQRIDRMLAALVRRRNGRPS